MCVSAQIKTQISGEKSWGKQECRLNTYPRYLTADEVANLVHQDIPRSPRYHLGHSLVSKDLAGVTQCTSLAGVRHNIFAYDY
jgi:hypothetical protein